MKTNVLIFPAGEVNSIELHDALSSCVNIKVFGASSIDRHGGYVFENYISGLPLINNPIFFQKFNAILEENQIDVIFPTHDTVATFFADNAEKIKAKIIAADKETSRICRNKKKTYQALEGFSFVPQTYKEITNFPVFIKPIEGQGSVGAKLVNSLSDITGINLDEYVICEYLPGKEYTVDCFTDCEHKLRFVSPRSRDRMMAGVSVSGEIQETTPDIYQIAEGINERLNFMGLWWFQIKQDTHGCWKLLEVSTRCAGTMALSRSIGVNLPLLSVYTAMGHNVTIEPNEYKVIMDSSLIRRYHIDYEYDIVYFDFDDTLTLRGKINLKAIWFLYQCRNKGKKIILITRHEAILSDTLDSYCIHEKLFDEIIHITSEERKSDFINPERAIFIDNAYKERRDVKIAHHIPVFDVDGLDFLMDWRY